MPDRAGYTLAVYAIDVSPSMKELKEDVSAATVKSKGKTRLDLVKEFVARKCEPKVTSGRKTEAVGILSFGGKTNNQAHRAYVTANPEDEDSPYAAISCDVAIQPAKPKIIEEVLNLEVGEHEGNPVSAMMVALDMIHTHKHTKSWTLEVVLITDGESAFSQDEYEDAMMRFDELGAKLSVVGIDFQSLNQPVDKSKTRNKRLSEKFWRTFVEKLHERISQTTTSEDMLPTFGIFDEALIAARLPSPAVVNGTVSAIDLHIGSSEIDADQAITIPIRYSKATMKARPQSLSKAWKPAMDLQAPPQTIQAGPSSQLASSLAQQSQHMERPPTTSDLAAMISAEVKHHSAYVVRRPDAAPATQEVPVSQADFGKEGLDGDYLVDSDIPQALPEEDEELVAKEDIVKAWRFGSTWVPMEADTFEPLDTRKGVEVLGFFPRDAIRRHLLMGEVRFVWPDLTSKKAQIQFSSLVEGMHLRDMVAVVRWVLKDQAEPTIGLCVPEFNFPGEDKRLDYMFWVQLPFAEDEHNFWFPSLTTYKTSMGKVIEAHPLLPTDEQCDLMDELVIGMDLDQHALRNVKEEPVDEDMDGQKNEDPVWFEPNQSYNPVIHRIKEAIFHASLTHDVDADPLKPPHPELVKYFKTPDEIVEAVHGITQKLKEKLDVKKVPPRIRKKAEKEDLRPDEGYIDIDALFDGYENDGTQANKNPATPKSSKTVKVQRSPISDRKKPHFIESESDDDILAPSEQPKPATAKPKRGRLISNERPMEDFNNLVEGEGDAFRKAIQDLGAVVMENVEGSFSRAAFPLAIECLQAMRQTALMYEEVETYNEYVDELESFINAPKFKHRDFWKQFLDAGEEVGKITPEQARAALEDYE
ncbi:MAG: ATP-dependent DNA helicase II subunit 2 [Tremellales sp. Tagirdzhanova-0007]|nr:MAG: ATP-dependent DNA helicase II subunit 2 [Tremellales sp. Tagirdzhanova-0007]